jgi:ribosome-associated protein
MPRARGAFRRREAHVIEEEGRVLSAVLAALEEGKALDPVVLDLQKLTAMTDYFVIAHGTNVRQVQALARQVEERLAKDHGMKPHHVEGLAAAQWALLDYGYFIVHLFLEEKRGYYSLERIWMDAPRIAP